MPDQPDGSDDSIKVFVRVRPFLSGTDGSSDLDRQECLQVDSLNSVTMLSKPEPKVFTFDRVAGPQTTQEEVFGVVGRTIVESCMQGYNGTIFAYGQTGSGKTFTMIGPSDDGQLSMKLRGVIPRTLDYLFSLINREHQKRGDLVQFLCKTSFLEIYNEQVFDLLDTASVGLHLRENIKRGVYVDGITEKPVASAKEAFDVLSGGWSNRRVAATSMNRESSRSHAVFTLTVESKVKESPGAAAKIKTSQLHLVDLAGSERQRDTHAVGTRLKEAGNINRSLSTLGNVIMALVDQAHGKSRHVPYRDSKLTFLLRDSLGGNSKTFIIANVSMASKCFGETLSTLSFARRAKMIRNRAIVNEDTLGNVTQLQLEIKKLKEELNQMKAGIIRNPSDNAPPYSQTGFSTPTKSAPGENKSTSELRDMLLSAMENKQLAEREKQALCEKVEKLEDVVVKKDKFLQSTKMILKFRETHISNLESRLKKAGCQDLESQTMGMLRSEIDQLRLQLDSHPEVQRFALENLRLREEVKKLQSQSSNSEVCSELSRMRQYCGQLEAQLLEEKSRHKAALAATPKRRDRRSGVGGVDFEGMAAELDRYKTMAKQLQVELKSSKQSLSDQAAESKQKHMELEMHLAGVRQSVKDLEQEKDALKLRSNAMSERHRNTIKTMLTPTPDRLARRRSSDKLAASSAAATPQLANLRMALFENETPSEGVMDEPMPEAIQEALSDELLEMQTENKKLTNSLETLEESERKLKTENAELVYRQAELDAALHEGRDKSRQRELEMMEELDQANEDLGSANENRQLLRDELRDIKLLLVSSDKELQAARSAASNSAVSSTAELAQAQAEITRLEGEITEMQAEHETVVEDFQQIQNEMETMRAEASFKDSQLEEFAQQLARGRETIKCMEAEHQATMEKLASEVEKTTKLSSQLHDDDKNQEQYLRSVNECSELRTELADLSKQLEDQAVSLQSSSVRATELESEKAALERQIEQLKSDMALLMESVNSLKAQLAKKEAVITGLQQEAEDHESTLDARQKDLVALNAQVAELQQKLEDVQQEMKLQQQNNVTNYDMLSEDYEFMVGEHQKVSEQLTARQADLESATSDKSHLEQQVSDLQAQLKSVQEDFESRLANVKSQQSAGDEDLMTVVQAQEDELAQLKTSESRYIRMLADLEEKQQERRAEAEALKLEISSLQSAREESEALSSHVKSLTYELDTERALWATSKETLVQEKETAETNLSSALGEKASSQAECSELRTLLTDLQERHDKLGQTSAEQLDSLKEELRRAQALEQTAFEQAQELRSQLAKIDEEKTKAEQEVAELREKTDKLAEERAKLAGHQNTKQRIQVMMQMKKEHNTLQDELARVRGLLKNRSDHVCNLEDALKKNAASRAAQQRPAEKENKTPP
ncbi:kinesin-like protein KIF15 [Sycon ciliatum]|uniref:kinesin-like protein KIF15 n=1 Tax=Sycon ciliatum TaxID=27933 RepID=UPI0031F6CD3D